MAIEWLVDILVSQKSLYSQIAGIMHGLPGIRHCYLVDSEGEFAGEQLADYKLPESITFIDALPKGATGKIDRKLLRQYDKS